MHNDDRRPHHDFTQQFKTVDRGQAVTLLFVVLAVIFML